MLNVFHKNLFESQDDGIILTFDGAARGLEGNLARTYARLFPDAWDEVEECIHYPLALGTTQAIKIPEDIETKHTYCFIASTLHHIDVLSETQKLKIQANALRHALSLAQHKGLSSLASAVMIGGWRLEFETAFKNMLDTYAQALSISERLPRLNIYCLSEPEYDIAQSILEELE